MQILEIANQMALHTSIALKRPLHQHRIIPRRILLRPRFLRQLPRLILLMQVQPLRRRQRQTIQTQIRIRRPRIPSPIPHINLLIRIQQIKINGVVPVMLKQTNIHVIHADNPHADIVPQLLAQR